MCRGLGAASSAWALLGLTDSDHAGPAFCRPSRLLCTPSKLPYRSLPQAASEAYEAAKDAASGIAHGARGAARSAAGAGTVAKDMGGRAAGSASDAATDAYNTDAAKTAAVRRHKP